MKGTSRLIQKVGRFLAHQHLAAGRMVVAVSGGPDSVALLHALLALRAGVQGVTANSSRMLVIAHLNHQLRGAESDGDEEFVRTLGESLRARGETGLYLAFERIDVRAEAQAAKRNLEAAARRIRYAWLARVASEHGLGLVVTGHTADDQAETVLHRLLRGTGVHGLAGIPPRRHLTDSVEVIRPMLCVTRSDVLSYLESEKQRHTEQAAHLPLYRADSSNADRRYTRNRIRHELLPVLAKEYNPAIVPLLCRLGNQARTASRSIRKTVKRLLAEAERPRAGKLLIFDRDSLAAQPRPLVREVFRFAWSREHWPQDRMSFEHWDRLAGVVFAETPAVDLPGGIRAVARERVVQIGPLR